MSVVSTTKISAQDIQKLLWVATKFQGAFCVDHDLILEGLKLR